MRSLPWPPWMVEMQFLQASIWMYSVEQHRKQLPIAEFLTGRLGICAPWRPCHRAIPPILGHKKSEPFKVRFHNAHSCHLNLRRSYFKLFRLVKALNVRWNRIDFFVRHTARNITHYFAGIVSTFVFLEPCAPWHAKQAGTPVARLPPR